MKYRTDIGLEIHVQLRTKSKMFCSCANRYGEPPNTLVCPVCLGYPGAMPAMNEEAIRSTVLTGLMIGCSIRSISRFDRKSYFYPDMPKNYQISQYDKPLCDGGSINIATKQGERRIGITRIHLEEDVAKNMHFAGSSGIDFNRAGVPLMEIVTEPDLHSPEEAHAFLTALKHILRYVGVSDCNMEQGNIRCDVNCSIRPEDSATLGVKTELKNLNTFKGVLNSLQYEIHRQTELLSSGGKMVQETRRWDSDTCVTYTMRTKEDAHDYRYFPEPDLLPVALKPEMIDLWKSQLPELPADRRARFVSEYGIPDYDAGVLVADRNVADFFEKAARLADNAKLVSNWVMTDLLRCMSEQEKEIDDFRLTPESLAGLVRLTQAGTINSNTAKEIFTELVEKGGDPAAIVQSRGLGQVSDKAALMAIVEQVVKDNAKSAADFRAGKAAALKFLVGQVMRLSKGKANPELATNLLKEILAQ